MNILVTGFLKSQAIENFFERQQLKVVTNIYSLVQCLRDMGHNVEQRMVEVGEDLKKYDEVIVYLHDLNNRLSRYTYNSLGAIYNRPDCVLAYDDWQTNSVGKSFLKYENNKEGIMRSYILDGQKYIPDNIHSYSQNFVDAITQVLSKTNRLLLSAYSGGDVRVLSNDGPEDLVWTFNPNPYHWNKKSSIIPENKERVFNYAGVVQRKTNTWLKRQKISDTNGELKMYGNRKLGQERLTEQEMVNKFAEHGGILLPGYYHAGSGWGRARTLQTADAGSILIGNRDELMIYYRDEELSNKTAIEISNMSDEELRKFAKLQKDALYSNHPLDKSVEQQELSEILK